MTSVLIIEEDDLFREVLGIALTELGYAVTQAADGETGMKLFRAVPTDLVLTDIVMPNKDGIAVVAELRRDYPKLGIIAMSGGLMHDARLKIAGAGANRTLMKPFNLPTLLAAIEEVLKMAAKASPPPCSKSLVIYEKHPAQ